MARVGSTARLNSAAHWGSTRSPRLFVWDVTLVLAIVLSLAFLVTRTSVAPATILTELLGQGRSATAEEPARRAVDSTSVAELISSLKDPDSRARIHAAQELGARHAVQGTDALLAATYDSNARVRAQAAAALGEIGAIQALPRLQELVVSGNANVEIAAFEAQGRITKDVASILNVPRSSLQVLAVAQQALSVAQNGAAYAAASNELYALHQGAWEYVGHLPDSPNNISVAPDGRLLFMATEFSGLYRSEDGGKTWEHVQFGLQTPTQLTVTAVAVNPQNVRQIFVALAATNDDQQNALGIAASNDGGKTWIMMRGSPNASVTRTLILVRTTPRYLYGLSDVGPWRYALPPT